MKHKRNTLTLEPTSSFLYACEFYMETPQFAALSSNTQVAYANYLKIACKTLAEGLRPLGNIKVIDIRFKHVSHCYDTWLSSRGTRQANYLTSCLSVVFNTCIRSEAMLGNPITVLKKTAPKQRKVKWTHNQVKLFLTTAYAEFEYRSIGLIVHMAYEWAQRIGDMRNLKWEHINFDEKRLDTTQSKRGAEVHLPIGDDLMRMLIQQREDFGFQEYVAPRVKPRNGAYTPYDIVEVSGIINAVKDKAGLPSELYAMDLRRTAITEMVEAGVDLAGIMQVSGHSNPASVKPYLVNTLRGATMALDKRWEKK